jgi:fatty acid desaturase
MASSVVERTTRDSTVEGARPKSAFPELVRRVREAQLLERRPRPYILKASLISVGILATAAAIMALNHSWWALLLAPVSAVLSAQTAFFAHDAGHKQISSSAKVDRRLGLVAADVLNGVSYGWWQDKHLRHHAHPNEVGQDPDVAEGMIAWTEAQAAAKKGWRRWFARHQGQLFFPVLILEGWQLSLAGIRALGQRPRRTRVLEGGLLIVHFAVYFGFLFVFLTPLQAVVFALVHQALFGLNLGVAFAPNHKGMLMLEPGTRLDHLHKQVLTSRDVIGGPLVDFMLGGLNYQIEHHLFPSLPRPLLKTAQPVVRQYCLEVGIPYRESTFTDSMRQIVGYLRRAGA